MSADSELTHVVCLPDKLLFDAEPNTNLLQVALKNGIPFTHACGGNARCSTCRIRILEGLECAGERSEAEEEMSQHLKFDPQIRLACQTHLKAGVLKFRRLVLDQEDYILTKTDENSTELASVGTEDKVAILFADIRGFTNLSEALPPYDVIHILDRYFHQMGRVIQAHGGYTNNYMGDGFLALFERENAANPCLNAVKAGLKMFVELKKLNPYLISFCGKALEIGIGIHYGDVVLGTVGYGRERRRTAIGDSVNYASRIEAANKEAGTHFLISQDVLSEIPSKVQVGEPLRTSVRGKTGEYMLYEVKGLKPGQKSRMSKVRKKL